MLTKIVSVLERLKQELAVEIKDGKEAFDKAMCWCKSESKAKDDAVCKLKDTVTKLKQRIADNKTLKLVLEKQIKA